MAMERESRALADAHLAGAWLRHHPADPVHYAPVVLPDSALGLCRVEWQVAADVARQVFAWIVFDRVGERDGGTANLPAGEAWEALAYIERALAKRGVRFGP